MNRAKRAELMPALNPTCVAKAKRKIKCHYQMPIANKIKISLLLVEHLSRYSLASISSDAEIKNRRRNKNRSSKQWRCCLLLSKTFDIGGLIIFNPLTSKLSIVELMLPDFTIILKKCFKDDGVML